MKIFDSHTVRDLILFTHIFYRVHDGDVSFICCIQTTRNVLVEVFMVDGDTFDTDVLDADM